MSRTARLLPYGRGVGRDSKPWFKPPKWYKQMRQQARRSAEHMAIVSGIEPPRFKHENTRDWS